MSMPVLPPLPSSLRPIDAELRRRREYQAIIQLIEAGAVSAVTRDAYTALRLAIAASEMRAELVKGAMP